MELERQKSNAFYCFLHLTVFHLFFFCYLNALEELHILSDTTSLIYSSDKVEFQKHSEKIP